MSRGPGHHQREILRLLVRTGGQATTRQLLRACYGPRKRRFTRTLRWSMTRAAWRWARSVRRGVWQAKPELLALIRGDEG